MRTGRFITAAVVSLGLGAVLAGQQPPVFRSGVDVVTVDTLVVDGEGRPIVGLERDDFTLTVDGQARPIDAVQFIAVPQPGPARATLVRLPDVSSNDVSAPGRLVLIVVDRTNIRRGEGRLAMEGLTRFVEGLSPADRAGLYTFPAGGPQVELTSDRRALLAALPRIRGAEDRQNAPFITLTLSEAFRIDRLDRAAKIDAIERNCVGLGTPPANDDPTSPRASRIEMCAQQIDMEARTSVRETRQRTEETLARLETLLESLRFIEGPKVLVFVSEGMALDREQQGRLRTFGSRVAASGTSFYAVQMYVPPIDTLSNGQPPDWEEDRSLRAEGLSFVAGISGGALFRPGPSLDLTFDRVARELSARYVLSFTVASADRDGKPHTIGVALKDRRSARIVRHRTEFTLPAQAPRFSRSVETLEAALSEPLPLSALPVRVGAYAVPEGPSTELKVLVAAEIGAAGDPPAAARTAFEVFDAEGRRVARGEDAVPASGAMPLHYTSAVRLVPGSYRVKLAARDAAGRIGSVDHPLEVEAAGDLDLALSSLMLFEVVEEGATEARPVLVFDLPAQTRVFGAHVIARGHGDAAFADARAVLEVTGAEDGVMRVSRTMSLVDGAVPGQKGFDARVSARGWPPGDYVATVTVLRGGRTVGQVSRSLVLREGPVPDALSSTDATARPAPAAARTAALVSRGGAYVTQYAERASSTVAEERYVQAIFLAPVGEPLVPIDEALAWREDPARARERPHGVAARRQLRSDLLMVRTANGLFTNYRDVSDVDGKPVKDRDRRALSLFTSAGDHGATLRRVTEEGARYNLGTLRRTINVPTLPLFALHPAHAARFAFDAGGRETVDGVETTVLRFREQRAPAFITTPRGTDVFTAGRIWIADDGRVLKTSLLVNERDSGMKIAIDVTYHDAPGLGLLMPAEMRELYSNLPGDARRVIAGRASYGNFRKFVVEVGEGMK